MLQELTKANGDPRRFVVGIVPEPSSTRIGFEQVAHLGSLPPSLPWPPRREDRRHSSDLSHHKNPPAASGIHTSPSPLSSLRPGKRKHCAGFHLRPPAATKFFEASGHAEKKATAEGRPFEFRGPRNLRGGAEGAEEKTKAPKIRRELLVAD